MVLGTPNSAVAMVVQFPVPLLAATSKIFYTSGVLPSFFLKMSMVISSK